MSFSSRNHLYYVWLVLPFPLFWPLHKEHLWFLNSSFKLPISVIFSLILVVFCKIPVHFEGFTMSCSPLSFHGMTILTYYSDFLDGPKKHKPNHFHPNNFNLLLPKSLKSLYSVWFNNVIIRFLIFSFHMKVHFNTYFVICALKYKDCYFLIEEHDYYMFLAWPTFIFENLFIKITLLWFSELVMWNKKNDRKLQYCDL